MAPAESKYESERAFCADESGALRASSDGKPTTGVSSGTVVADAPKAITQLAAPSSSASGSGADRRGQTLAVKQWKYKPYLLNGKPVEVETQVQVNFVLREQ